MKKQLLFTLAGFVFTTIGFAITTTITSTSDAGAGSLRQAIIDAQSGDTLLINPSDTIKITSGQMNVDKDLIITGPAGTPTKVISGEGVSKLFKFNMNNVDVTLTKLRLVNAVGSRGAAVYALKGTLKIDSCHFENNIANALAQGYDGGGAIRLYNGLGNAIISNSTFKGNQSIHTYSSTSSVSLGGAIYSTSYSFSTQIFNCTFESNYAQCYAKVYGGAVALHAVPAGSYLENCTFYDNKINSLLPRAAGGAGLYISGGYPLVRNNTIVANEVQSASIAGAGISVDNTNAQITNNLISGNILPGGNTVPERADFYCTSVFTSNGYNLIEVDPGPLSLTTLASDIVGQNPAVLTLTDNGGLTKTIGFDCASPAYGAGNPAFSGNQSQNGITRTASPDIGAYQKHDLPAVDVTTTNVTCAGGINGTAQITAPAKKWSHTWSPSQTTGNSVNNLTAGNYYVTTVANGCTVVDSFIVTHPDSVKITALITDDNGSQTGAIDITTAGGSAPYTYLWNTLTTGEDLTNIWQGTYNVTATDNAGCKGNDSFTVNLATSLNELTDSNYDVFPNPSQGSLYITGINYESIDVINVHGKTINTLSKHDKNVNVDDPGLYYFVFKLSNGNTETKKVLIQ